MSENNFKSFMVAGLKRNDILTFKGVDTFKDDNGNPTPLKFKPISKAEAEELRKKFTIKTPAVNKNGNYIITDGRIVNDIEVDYVKYTDALIVETMVYPNLKDKELLDYYGVYAGTELLHILFKGKDYDYVDRCAAQAADLIPVDESKLINELKN